MTDAIRGVREGYDRWAAVYERDDNPMLPMEAEVVASVLPDVRGLDVIDLGCGTGRHAARLAAAGARVTAVDFSEGMLAEARTRPGAESIRFVVHDLHAPLPFPDASFDTAVSGLVVEHLADLPAFFATTFRVLRPGGVAVVSAMHPAMFLRGAVARFTDPETNEVVAPGSIAHPFGALVLAALRAGFRVDDLVERVVDEAFAERFPRSARYLGWPMLLVMRLVATPSPDR
jgi:malonyl-CoA O-methyltransferase